jgi:uncharacterized membrane protein YedE/YeeE
VLVIDLACHRLPIIIPRLYWVAIMFEHYSTVSFAGLWVLCVGLAGLIGFAAHRASICSVRAMSEIITTGHAYMLGSFIKTVLWSMAITLPLLWLVPNIADLRVSWHISMSTIAGGFIFGVGAALNRGCALATLIQLFSGRLAMGLTILGFIAGLALTNSLQALQFFPVSEMTVHWLSESPEFISWILIPIFTWAAYESRTLWRGLHDGHRFSEHVNSPRYKLSSAAALMGLANGLLFMLAGGWAYTSILGKEVTWHISQTDFADNLQEVTRPGAAWLLVASLAAGIFISARQSDRMKLEWRPSWQWAHNITAGTIMGIGAALVPGGNDALLLGGMPVLAPHALPAFAALLAGIAVTLLVQRQLGRLKTTVDCHGDLCREAP